MTLENTQPNQERNLALERHEAVTLHNEILKEEENFSDEDKKWDIAKGTNSNPKYGENISKRVDLRKTVENIDKYRELAISKENLTLPEIGDISDVEKIKKEKEKIDKEVEKITRDIEKTQSDLNDLRKKLNLPQTNDIPSLSDKKQKLENLLVIKNDLDSKLDFEIKKGESQKNESSENEKIEGKNMNMGLEDISSDIKKIASILDERQSRGYNSIFSDEDGFRSVAGRIGDSVNKEEIKSNLARLGSIVEDFADNRGRGVNDDTENLYGMVNKLRQLVSSLQELPHKIQNEDERKELSQITNAVAEKVDTAASRITRKAQAIEEFLS